MYIIIVILEEPTPTGIFLYADLNECENSEHNCHQFGICTNNFGSFSCHCMRGYTGNGTWCEGERELKNLAKMLMLGTCRE